MAEAPERTQYASSILVSQAPIDATEIVRVRLSQAKLLNDEFSNFFKRYYDIKAQYLQQLAQLVSRSEDLNKNIEHSIVENNVLSHEELKHYNLDAIGHLSEIWNKVIAEIKDEVAANNSLKKVVETDVIKPLTDYTAKNRQWGEIRNLHSKLSDVAKNIETSQEKLEKYGDSTRHHDKAEKYSAQLQSANATWDSEAPYVFEMFEHTDFARLNFLRDSLLRFITAYTDSLNKISHSNEETLSTILNFDPEREITRFAKVSSETTYVPKEARKAAESPQVKNVPQPINSATATPTKNKRVSSIATTATAASVATAGTAAAYANGSSDGKKDKKKGKLRSRVGSVFRRKDKKDKNKLNIGATVPESETSSINDSLRAPTNRRTSRTSSFLSLGNNHSTSHLGSNTQTSPLKDPSPLQREVAPPAVPQKPNAPTTPSDAPMSLNQAPLKPMSRASSNNNLINGQQSINSYSETSSHINTSATQSPVDNNFQAGAFQPQAYPPAQSYSQPQEPVFQQEQQYPATLAPQPVEQDQQRAPPPPPSRKTNTLTNIREDAAYSFEQPVEHQSSHGQVPQPPVNRRDIQSGLFTNLNATDLENNQNKRISSFNAFAGSVSQLRPQMTGSSISGATGLFQHPDMTHPGLNASVAEVINAKFKDGEQVQGQVIGEIALNYHSGDMDIPTRSNLKIQGCQVFDKTMPNNQFFKQIDSDEFEITPSAILGRTLGGLKYSIKDVKAPIIILPAWRFEPHQSSVMLTLKLTPEIASLLQPGEYVILEDLVVSVSIKGASKSALSKPQGTFSKDKSRITWRFKEPVKLSADTDEKLVARFMTDEQGAESDSGVLVKFTVNDQNGAGAVTSKLDLIAQDFSEDDPFGETQWVEVPTVRTLVAGSYSGLA